MKKMKKRMLIGTAVATSLFLAVAGMNFSHAETAFKSRGILYFDNHTAETVDDVIFDASDFTKLDASITILDARITTLSATVDEGKNTIIDALEKYSGVNIGGNGADGSTPSFDEIAEAIKDLTVIPADTYFYVEGTEGDSNIIRYKKVDGKYYSCNAHGEVAADAKEVSVEGKTLHDYAAALPGNISAGSAAFADGSLHLGNGSDNATYYNQGFVDGQNNITNNLNISYTYHTHEGDSTNGGGCYLSPNMVEAVTGYEMVTEPCNNLDIVTKTDDSGSVWDECTRCGGRFAKGSVSGCYYDITYQKPIMGQQQQGWQVACGKSDGEIETATIVY